MINSETYTYMESPQADNPIPLHARLSRPGSREFTQSILGGDTDGFLSRLTDSNSLYADNFFEQFGDEKKFWQNKKTLSAVAAVSLTAASIGGVKMHESNARAENHPPTHPAATLKIDVVGTQTPDSPVSLNRQTPVPDATPVSTVQSRVSVVPVSTILPTAEAATAPTIIPTSTSSPEAREQTPQKYDAANVTGGHAYLITTEFGQLDPHYYGPAGHPGMDFGVPLKTPIESPVSGIVKVASLDPNSKTPGVGYGNEVIVETTIDGKTIDVLFGHLSSFEVKAGQKITQGTEIGLSGGVAGQIISGASTGPHLHFEVREVDASAQGYHVVNPETILDVSKSRDLRKKLTEKPQSTPAPGYTVQLIQPSSQAAIDARSSANEQQSLSPIEAMKQEIEQKYGVVLLSDTQEAQIEDLKVDHTADDPRYSWTIERMTQLREFLDQLPRQMYAPENGEPITFTVASPRGGGWDAEFSQFNQKRIILLNTENLDSQTTAFVFRRIVHELTHATTPDINGDSSWYEAVSTILDGDFSAFAQKQKGEILDDINVLNSRYQNQQINLAQFNASMDVYDGLWYGFSQDKPTELLAAMSEAYISGHEYFMQYFTQSCTEKQAQELYQFVKQNMFHGKEYQSFPTFQ